MISSLKWAIRSLRKAPGFTVTVMLVLALGIGANTAIFSLFHQVVLASLPVPQPDRLVNLSAPGPKNGGTNAGLEGSGEEVFSYPMFRDLERLQKPFTGIAAHVLFKANLAYKGFVATGAGVCVSGSYFDVLGLRAALGRLISRADDVKVGASLVAVLSYDYWRSRFAASTHVLNDTLIVNGQALTISGVAPRGFMGTAIGLKPQVFVPITLKALPDKGTLGTLDSFNERRFYWVNLFARLKPDISLEQAKTSIQIPYRGILNDVEAQLPPNSDPQTVAQFRAKEIQLSAGSYGRSMIRSQLQLPLTLLLAVTGLVLLIACANIANLLFARGAARAGEIALRLSLGATPRWILFQLLTESGLLALGGGLLGLAFAYWTLRIIALFLPQDFLGVASLTIDAPALAFASGAALGTALLFGLLPSLRSARSDLYSTIKGCGTRHAGGHRAARARSLLIVVQAIMAMTLLVPGGLLIRSLSNVARIDTGVNSDHLVTFRVSPELNGYTPVRSRALFERLESELSKLPGVSTVSTAMVPILSNTDFCTAVSVQGFKARTDSRGLPVAQACFNQIGIDYFQTLGVPLMLGREFRASDAASTGKVAIVNETFAAKYLSGTAAIGKWMAAEAGNKLDTQIIGVVKDTKYGGVKEETIPQFYLPYRQDDTLGSMSFYIRSAMPPQPMLRLAQGVVARLDPNLPVEDPKTMDRQIDESVFLDRLMTALCVAFAVLATLLAAVGLYGVLTYAVTQHTREIGVRMALGARSGSVAWSIVRNALTIAAVGVGIGGLIALVLTQLIRHVLFGVQPHDPGSLVSAGLLLLVVATLAAGFPAWRASRIDPIIALRAE